MQNSIRRLLGSTLALLLIATSHHINSPPNHYTHKIEKDDGSVCHSNQTRQIASRQHSRYSGRTSLSCMLLIPQKSRRWLRTRWSMISPYKIFVPVCEISMYSSLAKVSIRSSAHREESTSHLAL